MEGNVFVNHAIHMAIEKYLKNKNTPDSEEFQSFLVVVIRILILIYGELDIINPYRTQNEKNLGGFDANLKKFGLSDAALEEFKSQCLEYEKNEQNPDLLKFNFIKIQRILVDMFLFKKLHVLISDEELANFRTLLYSQNDPNAIKLALYNRLTPNSTEIMDYLNSKLFEQKHNFVLTEYKDIALDKEAYQLAGYNSVEVLNMSDQEILNINNKVYHFFRIKDTDLNKKKRLESAIEYYKKYGNAITSGNGYVDMLLLSSVVATGLMIAIIIAMQFVG